MPSSKRIRDMVDGLQLEHRLIARDINEDRCDAVTVALRLQNVIDEIVCAHRPRSRATKRKAKKNKGRA